MHWPASAPGGGQVPLIDVDGRHLSNDLLDGQQVEIVAWRPRSRESALYKIRRVADGCEGWIDGRHLRRLAVAAATENRAGDE